MSHDNVHALRPFVVTADVVIEFYLSTMTTTLCFGPFESKESAMEWTNVFETEHKEIEAEEDKKYGAPDAFVDFASEPYLRAYVTAVDITQPARGGRSGLIKPEAPIVDAHHVHLYTLGACVAVIEDAMEYLKGREANE